MLRLLKISGQVRRAEVLISWQPLQPLVTFVVYDNCVGRGLPAEKHVAMKLGNSAQGRGKR